MKKWGIIAALMTAMLFLGCNKKEPPETVAKAFVSSFITGDMNSFDKYATDSTKGVYIFAMSIKCDQDTLQNHISSCLKKLGSDLSSVEVEKVSKISDSEVLVTLKELLKDGKTRNIEVPVIKTKSGWKVNIKK